MSNKYCNLVGTRKISEDFNNINIGFDRVEKDIDKNKVDINNLSFTGSNHDPLVTSALVDSEGVNFGPSGIATYLNGRLSKWEQRITNLGGEVTPEQHRMIFRGKNLGTVLTSTQKTNIQNGSFDDLFLGDYWIIGGQKWRIVDFDYWYNCGDTAFTKHHLVIMPDNALYNEKMNETNTTEGGYVGSLMYTANLENAKTIINSTFGSAVLTHREYLTNAVSNGRPSGGAWYDSSVELPNECMMYGHLHFSPVSDGSVIPSIYTVSKTQLALFQVVPKFIVNRSYNQWLRDVVSSAIFAYAGTGGHPGYAYASNAGGVRPAFPIG